ncbi:dihydroxy-acid dehydratase2 [Octadecabacter arcticus 238]|uniref:Dihydroxy-acid dehydratase2 n=1 Tax=Octadecabacter arcticus 238 TaxID=391616 RepID=M9RL64_9RHOB|nr:IlvD/Edd family dehydratase [Octadecabacter arcticus]AGI72488.1 dihydroxy-acid dehydratase2 [Octadecabacter arcticus 238]
MSGGKKQPLRSRQWYQGNSKSAFMHRSWMKNRGVPDDMFDGRPVIGICNTFSEMTPCNAHLRGLAEKVKFGIYEAGGFPVEFPVLSPSESQTRPTAMLYRNLAAMDVEESIRSCPIDGVVLMAGCDKTTPSLVMGAASCDIPAILVSGGPMLNGVVKNERVGSGTAVFRWVEELNAGTMSEEDFLAAEAGHARSAGSCMTMGTASTMAAMVEAMGLGLFQNAAIPAVDSRRAQLSQMAGRRIVDLTRARTTIGDILTREAFENAIRVNAAIGGSTNAVLHLIAIARRMGVDLSLDDWDRLGRGVPTIVDLMPSGRFLMEDFYYAGGLPAVMRILGEHNLLHREALTVSGGTVWDQVETAEVWNEEVIRGWDKPLTDEGGIAVLRGNLAPRGAVLKPSAASPELFSHRGRAVVFSSIEDYHDRINDPDLDVDETSILVLQNCGPKGYPGMAEVGNMGLPKKLLEKGVRDMIRISDARMSGTAYGTVILHVAPEAAEGGPLAFVRSGDWIEVDIAERRLHLDVGADELDRRAENFVPSLPSVASGYQQLYRDHVEQADLGCDFDFADASCALSPQRVSH